MSVPSRKFKIVRTAFKCRAYPDPEQAAILARTFGCVRLVWNKALADRTAAWRERRERTSYAASDRALTRWKRTDELSFLSEVSSVPLQQALRHQHAAFAAFFAKRARYPRFKSRGGRQSAHYTRSAFRLSDGMLRLAKTTAPLLFVWSFDEVDITTLNPTTVIVSREPDGRWYVVFAVETGDPKPEPRTGREVGIDLGLAHFATTSDGGHIANPRHLEQKLVKLKRYQRRMARAQRGSKNHKKAQTKVAQVHREVRDARSDFLHKTSSRLVADHDLIVVEDLNVSGMVRNRSVARSISDASWGEFRRQLEYKCARAGRCLVAIDRWYPSSKICNECGYQRAALSLSVRTWRCPACRSRHDRDVNAAKNILAAGRAVARSDPGDACGAEVRRQGLSLPHSAGKQEVSQPVRSRAAAQL
jgi:putative transposase